MQLYAKVVAQKLIKRTNNMSKKFYWEELSNCNFNNLLQIDGEEFSHIALVLRKNVGDKLCFIDGYGYDYDVQIENITKKNMTIRVLNKTLSQNETMSNVAVFQALVKGDKFELITQKLTELGVNKIIPFSSEFCQVKPNTTRLDRLNKISIEALKQCGRAKKVEIENVCSFDQMIEKTKQFDLVLFAYENSCYNIDEKELSTYAGKNIAIIIGSEGGFSKKETEQLSRLGNVRTISLGKRILRAETASIALTSAVMFGLGEWKI